MQLLFVAVRGDHLARKEIRQALRVQASNVLWRLLSQLPDRRFAGQLP
jgi:hypothetical protein